MVAKALLLLGLMLLASCTGRDTIYVTPIPLSVMREGFSCDGEGSTGLFCAVLYADGRCVGERRYRCRDGVWVLAEVEI